MNTEDEGFNGVTSIGGQELLEVLCFGLSLIVIQQRKDGLKVTWGCLS